MQFIIPLMQQPNIRFAYAHYAVMQNMQCHSSNNNYKIYLTISTNCKKIIKKSLIERKLYI